MSRSLAFVGILTIVGVAGTWSAIGQDNTGQTSQGVVVKNHMSDAERDRLMQEAMDQARRQLEQEKAQQQAEQESQADAEKSKAEAAVARERAAAAAEEEKRSASDAAAKQKAKEEQLAAELAEAEKQSSGKNAADAEQKAGEPYDLDALKPLKSSKAPVKQASKPASEPKESSAEARKPSTASASEKKTPEVAKSKAKPSEKQKAEPEKTVIQTVSTKQPGSGLSVKTNMPVGDGERKAEQQRASAGYANSSTGLRNNRDANVSGVVVGLLRSSAGPPRILVNTEDRRMVQVVIEKSGADIPAAGAQVSIRGREIGGADGRPVISASSVSIKSGQALAQPEVQTPQLAAAPVPVPPLPRLMGPPPIMGHMPPPMPMLPGGPGMMLPPPPPF